MIRPRAICVVSCFLALSSNVCAQIWAGQAGEVPVGQITVDGMLNEPVWQQVKTKISAPANLGSGTVDNDADCYVEFTTLWSSEGWYLGVWFYDDVHAALNSQYLDAANIAYDDDGLQLLVDHSFEDGYNDVDGPTYQGLYGRSLVKGFGNLDPTLQYAGFWAEGPGGSPATGQWTIAQQIEKGWENAFSSDDGLNYQYESKFSWSGYLMTSVGTKNQGDAIGFNLVVNDNDGGFASEGQMTLVPLAADMGQRWGKVVLSGPAGIAPAKAVAPISNHSYKQFTFDPLGRRVANIGQTPIAKSMLITRSKHGQAIRSISKE